MASVGTTALASASATPTPPTSHNHHNNSALNGIAGNGGISYDRDDLVRLINQSLRALGYDRVADQLQAESNIAVEDEKARAFRATIENGQWDEACNLLDGFHDALSEEDKAKVKTLLYREKFLELLSGGNVRDALQCLRSKLQPGGCDTQQLHRLSQTLVSLHLDVAIKSLDWPGSPSNRTAILQQLESGPCSRVLTPAHRLDQLVRQALQAQRSACLYHNMGTSAMSLLYDHHCHRSAIPHTIIADLAYHDDEVWYLQFSHSGRMLATCSKDGHCVVWDVVNFRVLHVFVGHLAEVEFCAWSPDDTKLVTCGGRLDKAIHIWNTTTGALLKRLSFHTNVVSAVAWTPDGKSFITASMDQRVVIWNAETYTPDFIWFSMRVGALAITPSNRVVLLCHELKLHVFDVATHEKLHCQTLSSRGTSVCVSKNGREVLVGLLNGELQVWSIEPEVTLVQKYTGYRNGTYILRSCFGGAEEDFVVTGSEDGLIYLWHRSTGKLLEKIAAHNNRSVNAVAWSPTDHNIMASVGDDAQVHIWGVTQDSSSSNTPPIQVSTAGDDDDDDDAVVSDATAKKRTFSP